MQLERHAGDGLATRREAELHFQLVDLSIRPSTGCMPLTSRILRRPPQDPTDSALRPPPRVSIEGPDYVPQQMKDSTVSDRNRLWIATVGAARIRLPGGVGVNGPMNDRRL